MPGRTWRCSSSRAGARNVLGRDVGVLGRERSSRAALRARPHRRRRGDVFPRRQSDPHRRLVSHVSAAAVYRLRQRRQRARVDEDARRSAEAGFRYRDPGARPDFGPRRHLSSFAIEFQAMRDRIQGMVRSGDSKEEISKVLVDDYHWAAGGLAIQQVDAMIAELKQ